MNNPAFSFSFIGDSDTCLAFKTIGADTFIADNAADALAILKNLDDNYAICYILENLAIDLLDEIQKIRAYSPLAIVVIPSLKTSKQSIDLLKKDIEQAMGTDAIFRS